MDLVLKTSGQQCPVGSNPTPSADVRGVTAHPERNRVSQTTKPAKRGRRTVARHGELTSPHPLALMLKIVGVVAAVVLVSGARRRGVCRYDITASFTEDAVALEGQDPVPPDIGAIEGGVNLLLVGHRCV